MSQGCCVGCLNSYVLDTDCLYFIFYKEQMIFSCTYNYRIIEYWNHTDYLKKRKRSRMLWAAQGHTVRQWGRPTVQFLSAAQSMLLSSHPKTCRTVPSRAPSAPTSPTLILAPCPLPHIFFSIYVFRLLKTSFKWLFKKSSFPSKWEKYLHFIQF